MMGYCLMMRKGEVHTAPVTYKANFADNTWAQIIDACHKNKVPDTWAVGNSKVKKYNGSAYNWQERSPYGRSTSFFCIVNSNGNADYDSARTAFGVAFGFCF